MEKKYLSVAQAAELVGICEATMRALTHRDDFPVLVIGKRRIIPTEQLFAWLTSHAGEGQLLPKN